MCVIFISIGQGIHSDTELYFLQNSHQSIMATFWDKLTWLITSVSDKIISEDKND